jgi:2-polyprenyl-3-methyl-5-hydroxy-6-metoxy-1,4-benzoquinol methylase
MIGHYVETQFDEINDYEKFYEHHHFEPIPEENCLTVDEVIPRFGWAFDQVEELAPKNLLDLGCLDGSFALSVCDQLKIPVVGVDLTKDGIDLATRRAEKHGLEAQFYQGRIEDRLREFAERGLVFDVVTFFEIIEHVEDVQLVLSLIDKVLAPGGSVLVSTPDFESPYYGADDEANKCHVRLYTTAKEDYERPNKYGNVRKATSIYKEIGEERIQELAVHNELINVRYN